MEKNESYFIERAIRLAHLGIGLTSPNPTVGCVIVKDGEIVGEGYHIYSKKDHAEVVALKKAGRNTKNSTMYVTLEPCFHHGRTPPCVDRIIESGIKEVVILMIDPNPLVAGKSVDKLRQNGISVKVVKTDKRLKRLNEDFIKFITKKLPFVAIKVASTLDGKIATKTGDSKWITGKVARKYTHFLRYRYNSILVGINTILKDDPLLTCRYKKRKDIPFYRFVIDPDLRITSDARIFNSDDVLSPVVIFTKKGKYEDLNGKIVNVPDKNGILDLDFILKKICELNVSSVLIEGGGYTISKFIEANLVDKLHLFLSPKLMGEGKSFFPFEGVLKMEDAIKLKFESIKRFKEDVLLNFYF